MYPPSASFLHLFLSGFYLFASSDYFILHPPCPVLHVCPHLISIFFFFSQCVTAAGGQMSACLIWSSTGALAVEGDVWAAEITPTAPIVSAAGETTTGNLVRSLACPATAILMVCADVLYCSHNTIAPYLIHANIITPCFCFQWRDKFNNG